MIARTVTLALLLGLGVTAAPADAQRRQRYIEVFGNDRCPEGSNDEIIVCGRKPESDRFRIPTELRDSSTADLVTQESRVDQMVALGRTGTNSCSAVGPGGFTGCFQQQVQANRDEKKAVRRVRSQEPR